MFSLWLLILLSFVLESFSIRLVEEVQIRILKFKDCPNKNLPMKYNITIREAGKGFIAVDGYIFIRENVGNVTQMTVKLKKCKSYAESETCEYFTTCKYSNPCPFISAKNQVWSSFTNSIRPRMTCPFRKGFYEVKNASFDTSFINSVSSMNGMYWDAKSKMYVGSRYVSCIEIGIDFRKIRRKV